MWKHLISSWAYFVLPNGTSIRVAMAQIEFLRGHCIQHMECTILLILLRQDFARTISQTNKHYNGQVCWVRGTGMIELTENQINDAPRVQQPGGVNRSLLHLPWQLPRHGTCVLGNPSRWYQRYMPATAITNDLGWVGVPNWNTNCLISLLLAVKKIVVKVLGFLLAGALCHAVHPCASLPAKVAAPQLPPWPSWWLVIAGRLMWPRPAAVEP